jgi:hypothetical protein
MKDDTYYANRKLDEFEQVLKRGVNLRDSLAAEVGKERRSAERVEYLKAEIHQAQVKAGELVAWFGKNNKSIRRHNVTGSLAWEEKPAVAAT